MASGGALPAGYERPCRVWPRFLLGIHDGMYVNKNETWLRLLHIPVPMWRGNFCSGSWFPPLLPVNMSEISSDSAIFLVYRYLRMLIIRQGEPGKTHPARDGGQLLTQCGGVRANTEEITSARHWGRYGRNQRPTGAPGTRNRRSPPGHWRLSS